MSIRSKIILVVLPLLVAGQLITGIFSSFSARNGMTRIAMESLGFKAEELRTYAENQWNLLVENELADRDEYRDIARSAIASYASSLIRSPSELIFASDEEGMIEITTEPVDVSAEERMTLRRMIDSQTEGWVELNIAGRTRVGSAFAFEPFAWLLLVTEDAAGFYQEVSEIQRQSVIILSVSIAVSLMLLLAFMGYLTRPLRRVAAVMRSVIASGDMSMRARIEYRDEIGELAGTFNTMIGQLDHAYGQIKQFAYQAVLAQKSEHKVRNIFQKYVPKDVIDTLFMHPERMLVGDNRVLAVLFSDIRNFTTLSEGFQPDQLVQSLNQYFDILVDIIMSHDGIVDKYIGDAIMAFFGAPVSHDDDAVQAVRAALKMQRALRKFNTLQVKQKRPPFRTGIGINYGEVTVGNIGTEKKMDYTVIGDMVNLGSRLEGLTKVYVQQIVFSESVYQQVKNVFPCRMLDKVVVKGKSTGEKIFTAVGKLDSRTARAWKYHHAGLRCYYQRDFARAADYFAAVRKLLPKDRPSELFLERSKQFATTPPPADWDGQEIIYEK